MCGICRDAGSCSCNRLVSPDSAVGLGCRATRSLTLRFQISLDDQHTFNVDGVASCAEGTRGTSRDGSKSENQPKLIVTLRGRRITSFPATRRWVKKGVYDLNWGSAQGAPVRVSEFHHNFGE